MICAGGACQACVCDSTVISSKACFTEKVYTGWYFFMLLSLLWVSSVLSNVVHCTTAGAVASWWVTTDEELIELDENDIGIPFSVPLPVSTPALRYGRVNKGIEEGGHSNSNSTWGTNPCSGPISILKCGGTVFVVRSLRRSLTTSFGSICLGSLLVAVLRLVTGIVSLLTDRLRALHNSIGEWVSVLLTG